MAIASSRPVIQIAESAMRSVASIGKESPAAWWLSILIVAPVLGSFITEPAAMTIAALLLGQQFYQLDPSPTFKYATLGLLFVNISVGGTLTHFAAPPVLMVADTWHWDLPYMFTNFGWRAVLGVIVATAIYYFIFRKNFASLKERANEFKASKSSEPKPEPAPLWVIFVHLGFVAWTVLTLHHPAFFIGGFLFFLAFTMATHHHQYDIQLKSPLLVGFFLAGLVTHGGLQGWWISPVLSSLAEVPLFIGATILTAFNDNAAITFLASQVPAFSPDILVAGNWVSKTGSALANAQGLEYAVVAGAVTGGGLTVIANAPNPAGQSILNKHFKNGISPIGLLLGALFPTLIMAIMFMVLPH
jgi:Na+/H+ antiporter NhaD/arsenite permease-like protein